MLPPNSVASVIDYVPLQILDILECLYPHITVLSASTLEKLLSPHHQLESHNPLIHICKK